MWYWQMLEREEFVWKKDKCELKMNPRFLAEEVRGMDCVEGGK